MPMQLPGNDRPALLVAQPCRSQPIVQLQLAPPLPASSESPNAVRVESRAGRVLPCSDELALEMLSLTAVSVAATVLGPLADAEGVDQTRSEGVPQATHAFRSESASVSMPPSRSTTKAALWC